MTHFSQEEFRKVIDRLADGELSGDEYREALSIIEHQDEGWKQCALTFLETQALNRDLASFFDDALSESFTFEIEDDAVGIESSDLDFADDSIGESVSGLNHDSIPDSIPDSIGWSRIERSSIDVLTNIESAERLTSTKVGSDANGSGVNVWQTFKASIPLIAGCFLISIACGWWLGQKSNSGISTPPITVKSQEIDRSDSIDRTMPVLVKNGNDSRQVKLPVVNSGKFDQQQYAKFGEEIYRNLSEVAREENLAVESNNQLLSTGSGKLMIPVEQLKLVPVSRKYE